MLHHRYDLLEQVINLENTFHCFGVTSKLEQVLDNRFTVARMFFDDFKILKILSVFGFIAQ